MVTLSDRHIFIHKIQYPWREDDLVVKHLMNARPAHALLTGPPQLLHEDEGRTISFDRRIRVDVCGHSREVEK